MTERRPVLLTVSGTIPVDLVEQIDDGQRPLADYLAMQDAFDADLVDIDLARESLGRFGRLIELLTGTAGLLAWYCFRHRRHYEVIVTDGEQVGLPFALLCRLSGRGTARHMMIVHIVSAPKKARLVAALRLAPFVDLFVVYCSFQERFIIDQLGVPRDRVVLSTFMVDTTFFQPATGHRTQERLICSAGLERRDYHTLIEAVTELEISVVIAAASPWSKRPDSTDGESLPPNVDVRRLDSSSLRQLYSRARFVVMPLEPVEFQAGITTILEAMSMGRAVICTRTAGQNDTIVHGVTGLYVDGGDPEALRNSITELLSDPSRADRLGENARKWVVEHADVGRYASRLGAEVDRLRRCKPA